VDVDLTQRRVAGGNESMRCIRRNDNQPSQGATTWQASDKKSDK